VDEDEPVGWKRWHRLKGRHLPLLEVHFRPGSPATASQYVASGTGSGITLLAPSDFLTGLVRGFLSDLLLNSCRPMGERRSGTAT